MTMQEKYKTMIRGLQRKELKRRNKAKKLAAWALYILRCGDGCLYTGITNDVSKRFQTHQVGKGAKFTRTRLPLELLYQEVCASRSAALIREYEVKSFSKKRKEMLVLGIEMPTKRARKSSGKKARKACRIAA